jgi:hypothetical protein
LYYINQSGDIMWRTKLSAPINSEVFQVDANKTGELSYLFSTPKQAYLLSSSGVSMPGFPVYFPGTANASISVFDLYGDSTIQFFVPLDSKKIMGYGLNGKPIQGWNPKRTDVSIQTPLSAFRLATGAYIAASSANNGMWMSGISSKQQIPPALYNISALYPVQVFQTDTQFVEIWATDTNGQFVQYTLNGRLELNQKKVVATAPEDIAHRIIQTSGGYSLMAMHHLGFTIFDGNGKKVMTRVFADSLVTNPFYTYSKDHSPMVGYTEQISGTIHLIDLQGNDYPTLPISGSTPFTIGDVMLNNTNYLVCGDRLNSLLLYRLK